MWRFLRGVCLATTIAAGIAGRAQAQQALTWEEIKLRFEANNPTLRAGQIGVDESKAEEITAYLRPNPQVSANVDQIGNTTQASPFSAATISAAASYLHERRHKRELRRESANKAAELRFPTKRIWSGTCVQFA